MASTWNGTTPRFQMQLPPRPAPAPASAGIPEANQVPLDTRTHRQKLLDIARSEREKDLAAGQARGEEVFKEGSLGRLEGGTIDEILAARKAQAQGFTPEEQNAMRSENLANLNRQNGADARNARIMSAAEGVRGNRAVVMNNKVLADQGAAKAAMERDLFLKNIDAKRAGLDALQGFEGDRQKYNIEQKNKELQGRLTTELGYGSLGAADRGQVMQSIVGENQARAGQGGGSKK